MHLLYGIFIFFNISLRIKGRSRKEIFSHPIRGIRFSYKEFCELSSHRIAVKVKAIDRIKD